MTSFLRGRRSASRASSPFARVCAIAATTALLGADGPARAEIVLETGFAWENAVPGATWDTPVAVAFLPGGRWLVAEKRGRVYAVRNGVKHPTPIWSGEAEVLNQQDRGLLDVAVDPNYATNHYIYLLFTVDPSGGDGAGPGFGRVVRYQVSFSDSNALVPGSRTVLLGATWGEGPCSGSSSHTVGSLRWGSDGSLLVSAGEGAAYTVVDAGGLHPTMFGPGKTDPAEDIGAFRAQSLSSLAGKILRIHPATGEGYPSNPYYDGDAHSPRSKVWAYGLRNPFRFTVKPGTGSSSPSSGDPGVLYVGDVGWTAWEEIDIATQPGQNFGWPCFEGRVSNGPYQNADPPSNGCGSFGTWDNPAPARLPTVNWQHGNNQTGTPVGISGSCAVGGAFVPATRYPSQYRNRYFFADFSDGWIKVLVTDSQHRLVEVLPFAEHAQGPVQLAADPATGDLLYVSVEKNQIRRIRYTGGGGNDAPVAVAAATPANGAAPLTVSFSSEGSYDPDGDPFGRHWSFGDGATSTQANPQHTYAAPGTYQVVLTLDDGRGGIGQDGLPITVGSGTSSFPATPVLDSFDRPNGPIGPSWTGNTAGLRIASNALTLTSYDGSAVWSAATFGPTQEVHARLAQVTPTAPEHDLMLKVQGTSWADGNIEVRYDATVPGIFVATYAPSQGWVQRGSVDMTLSSGDRFGARAHADGTVEVFVSGARVLTTSVEDWPYAALGGRLGLTLVDAPATRLDDFGGGDVTGGINTPLAASIVSPADGSFYAAPDTVRLMAAASDAEQSAASLQYRWDVHLHHNTHVHPSSYSSDASTGAFAADDHEDGSGVWLEVVLRVTDSGGLADTARVAIFPETDLEPSPVAVIPDPPGSSTPARYRFALRNHGRMPAPMSRWVLRAGDVTLAQGDTVVAGRDSVVLDLAVPPLLGPGIHDLRVTADSLARVVETDEGNNAATRTLQVAAQQLPVDDRAPGELSLSEGFPNPSAGPVALALRLPRAARVSVAVHDLQGREVWRAAPRPYAAGRWTLEWPGVLAGGRPARPGLYLARVTVDGATLTRRIALLR